MTRTHFPQLRQMIRDEENRQGMLASHVRISKRAANELLGLDAKDWFEECGGSKSMDDCRRIADDFLARGEVAANGLSISPVGPVIEVSEDLKAPLVEILKGVSAS